MANPLIDKTFLKQLDEFPLREIYIRIVSLTMDENPLDEIQGRATGGSINLDGSSAIRRSCSLTMVVDDLELRDYYWGLKTKFKLEVGMKNFVDQNYENIIWFPQGIYLITQFSTTQNGTGYTVSISGKDKMSLLNGEIGGQIHANSTRFDIIEEYDKNGNRNEIKIPVREMIAELIHEYGNEPFHNIIINDVDEFGLELLEYRGKDPLYLLLDTATREVKQITRSIGNYQISTSGYNNKMVSFFQEQIVGGVKTDTFGYDPMVSDAFGPVSGPWIIHPVGSTATFTAGKIEYGQTVGYRLTELTYPGELVVSSGETVTGVLDKIKTMFSDFEYFYDINGRFVFQRKPIYTVKSWTPLRTDSEKNAYGKVEYYAESMNDVSPISYQFQSNKLLTQISNTPSYSNIKNDFSIWGKRTTLSGAEVPIHLRFAIQKKPTKYVKISDTGGYKAGNIIYAEEADVTGVSSYSRCDWRELIYQMALDYRRCNHDSDYEYKLKTNNPELAPHGKTGYEQYYIDMEAFWRELYNPDSINRGSAYNSNGWNKAIENAPESLNFWIDFLDTSGDMGKYSVDTIGDRSQIVNDDKIKSIYFKDTPLVIYYKGNSKEPVDTDRSKTGYTYFLDTEIANLLSASSQGKSAREELDNQLQNYTYATESISISALPVYYLQPNTRIEISNNEDINVNGEYIISKITLPLTHNGTMSISAIKDPQTLL